MQAPWDAADLRRRLRLYAVTDGRRGAELLRAAEDALRGGVTLLQYRAKGIPEAELRQTAKELLACAAAYGVPLILNDTASLAAEIGAAGAHLGFRDGDLRTARTLLPGKILGATARTVEQAVAAEAAGADYIGSGAVFGTATKADAVPMPLPLFRAICAAVRIPVVAIGGIHAENIGRLRGCGQAGYAVVGGIFRQGELPPREAAAALRRIVDGEHERPHPQ